jgi:hypothetical protein
VLAQGVFADSVAGDGMGEVVNILSDEIVKRGLDLAKGSTVFGKSFFDLSREELIAIAAIGWYEYNKQQKEFYSMLKDPIYS